MKFVRVVVNRALGEIVGVMDSDMPWVEGISVRPIGVEFEMVDLGVVADDGGWADLGGKRCVLSRHIFERLDVKHTKRVRAKPGHALPDLIDCPASLEGIKERLRARGHAGLNVKVRAWLALMLPRDDVAAMGIGRGLPIAALKAAESMRVRRDPHGGSRLTVLERRAQEKSDRRAKQHLRKRLKAAERAAERMKKPPRAKEK